MIHITYITIILFIYVNLYWVFKSLAILCFLIPESFILSGQWNVLGIYKTISRDSYGYW